MKPFLKDPTTLSENYDLLKADGLLKQIRLFIVEIPCGSFIREHVAQ
jgi:hypothetical protein